MDTIRLVLSAAWNVLWVGLLLGAGLPTLFAAGVRLLAGPADTVTADGIAVQHDAPGWHQGILAAPGWGSRGTGDRQVRRRPVGSTRCASASSAPTASPFRAECRTR